MKKNTTKTRAIIVLCLVVIAGIAMGRQFYSRKHGKIVLQKLQVTHGPIRSTILSTGTVQPENRLEVKPPIPGRVENVLVVEGQSVHAGDIIAFMSSTERAALLDIARSQGATERSYWEDAYKATPLIAPINGVIILKNVQQGQTVTASDAILTMSDRLIVKAQVDETDLAEVKLGQEVEIVLDAYPKHVLPGRVLHIAYDAKTINNVITYEVHVAAKTIPRFMKSGMTANNTFIVASKNDAVLVPAAAIHRDHGSHYVLLPNLNQKGDPISQEVTIGITDGKKTEVISGLNPGDAVLIAGVQASGQGDGQKPSNPFSPFGRRR